jgi:hypothetical protein
LVMERSTVQSCLAAPFLLGFHSVSRWSRTGVPATRFLVGMPEGYLKTKNLCGVSAKSCPTSI